MGAGNDGSSIRNKTNKDLQMTPTALERIKEIEEQEKIMGCIGNAEIVFLLKAFNNMREIAVRRERDLKIRFEDPSLRVPIWIYCEGEVDEEFEKLMSK